MNGNWARCLLSLSIGKMSGRWRSIIWTLNMDADLTAWNSKARKTISSHQSPLTKHANKTPSPLQRETTDTGSIPTVTWARIGTAKSCVTHNYWEYINETQHDPVRIATRSVRDRKRCIAPKRSRVDHALRDSTRNITIHCTCNTQQHHSFMHSQYI